MHLQKLSDTLKQLDKQQLKRFQAFMVSPYFGYSEKTALLLDYLAGIHPDFNEKNLNPDVISKKIQDIGTKKTQANLGSELMAAFEEFIANENWRTDKNQVSLDTLQGYIRNNFLEEANIHFEKELAAFEKNNLITSGTLDFRYRLLSRQNANFDNIIKRHNTVASQNLVSALDEHQALNKLIHMIEYHSRKIILNTPIPDFDEKSTFKSLERYLNPEYPIIYIFFCAYKLFTSNSDNEIVNYYNIIKPLFQNLKIAEISDAIIIKVWGYCSNTCLIFCNKGYMDWVDEYIFWIEWKEKRNFLLEAGMLRPELYLNVFVNCTYSKCPTEWFVKFAAKYGEHLPDSHRETYIALANGLLLLKKNSFKEATNYFDSIKEKLNPVLGSMVRRFHFVSVYESSSKHSYSELQNLLKSFSKFVTRNIDLMRGKESYFEDFISHCTKLINSDTLDKINKFITKMEQAHYFPGKPWILDKAKEKAHVLSTQALGSRKKTVTA